MDVGGLNNRERFHWAQFIALRILRVRFNAYGMSVRARSLLKSGVR